MNKDRMRVETSTKGVSLWVDGTWVIDASTFLEDGVFDIAMDRLKVIEREFEHHARFKFDDEKELREAREEMEILNKRINILEDRSREDVIVGEGVA